jgi:hypothetical protein
MAGGRVQGGVVGFKADTRPANRGIVLEYIAPLVTGNNVLATRSGHQYTRCRYRHHLAAHTSVKARRSSVRAALPRAQAVRGSLAN